MCRREAKTVEKSYGCNKQKAMKTLSIHSSVCGNDNNNNEEKNRHEKHRSTNTRNSIEKTEMRWKVKCKQANEVVGKNELVTLKIK